MESAPRRARSRCRSAASASPRVRLFQKVRDLVVPADQVGDINAQCLDIVFQLYGIEVQQRQLQKGFRLVFLAGGPEFQGSGGAVGMVQCHPDPATGVLVFPQEMFQGPEQVLQGKRNRSALRVSWGSSAY